jgi:hypothetical protein
LSEDEVKVVESKVHKSEHAAQLSRSKSHT